MKKQALIAAVIVAILGLSLGCKKPVRKSHEGITHKSFTQRFSGYRQSIEVKGEDKAIMAYLNNPVRWNKMSGVNLGVQETASEEPSSVGASFPFALKKMGMDISGPMVLVRNEKNEMWFIWDNPVTLQVQKWKFEQRQNAVGVTLRIDSEMPRQHGKVYELMEDVGLLKEIYKGIDLELAGIQEHFDPSLDPNRLVAGGLRGEIFDSFWQANQASLWLAMPPDQVIKLLSENADSLMPEIRTHSDCLSMQAFLSKPSGQVQYCPSVMDTPFIKADVDAFFSGRKSAGQADFRTYVVGLGMIGLVELQVYPQNNGSRVDLLVEIQTPETSSPTGMQMLMVIGSIPKRMDDALINIKNMAEKNKTS